MEWGDKRAMKILRDKVYEVDFPVGDAQYPNESKAILKYCTFSPTLKIRFPVMNQMTKKGLMSLMKSQKTIE